MFRWGILARNVAMESSFVCFPSLKKLDEALLKGRRQNLPIWIADSAIEFRNVKAWKMSKVGNKSTFEAGKL